MKNSNTHIKSSMPSAMVIVPPDSGWSWIVMIASFLCCTTIDGIVFSSGMIQDSLVKEFDVSKGYVALVSSILSGCYLIAGPLASALSNRFGFRSVSIAGAVCASAAFALSYYVSSIEILFFTYGILGGIGLCLIYIPSIIIIGFYFEKWRALATGVALCGSGVGTFLFAPLTDYWVKEFGWRSSLGMQALSILFCVIWGSTYRQIKPLQVLVTNCDILRKEDCVANHSNLKLSASLPSSRLQEGRLAYSVPNSAHSTYMGTSKHNYPTAIDIFQDKKIVGTCSRGIEMNNIIKSYSSVSRVENLVSHGHMKELSTVGETEEDTENPYLLENCAKKLKQNNLTLMQTRRHTVSERCPYKFCEIKKGNFSNNELAAGRKLMFRDDIFFTGSLIRIPQYTSNNTLNYHMSVTRLPSPEDALADTKCKICPKSAQRILSIMLDPSLLSSPSFLLLASSGFLTMMGFFVPFIFIVKRATTNGIDEKDALFILPAIGITNMIARIICGVLTSFSAINPLLLNNIAITAGGIATIVSGFHITKGTQYVFAAIFGNCIACFSTLRSLIAVEIMGLENLTNSFGLLMLFQGVAATIGTPIAGILVDLTGSYDSSFYYAGGLILLSAFICYPLNYINKWEKATNENFVNE